ncbi:hypothetical protein [Thiorhodococcus minor]|uniref:Uncharacterized protein n=1 Tax=Thiorhodococcus minor TaxID=57489 RepID=A0A6M0JXE9_9GAMM|nr:hypothetical protein [Thiorhodococcus minor]NEV62190.1 hypothetical protein [Thiorhodococcus minor]
MIRSTQVAPLSWALSMAAALSACAQNPAVSDRLVENRGAEGFLDRIEQSCGTLSVGHQQLKYLLGESSDDTYFIDETSKLYFGRVDKRTYATDLEAFYPGGTTQSALDCIFAQLDD